MWSSYAYYNMKITTKEGNFVIGLSFLMHAKVLANFLILGEEIKMREAVKHFLKSPAVQEFKKNLGVLYAHALEHGKIKWMGKSHQIRH